MNKKQFIENVFELAFGDSNLTKELIASQDYQAVYDKLKEYAVDSYKEDIDILKMSSGSSFMENYQEGGAGYDDTKEYTDPEFPEKDWKKEKKKEVADFFGGEVNGKV